MQKRTSTNYTELKKTKPNTEAIKSEREYLRMIKGAGQVYQISKSMVKLKQRSDKDRILDKKKSFQKKGYRVDVNLSEKVKFVSGGKVTNLADISVSVPRENSQPLLEEIMTNKHSSLEPATTEGLGHEETE